MQFERNGLRKVMEVCFMQNPIRGNNTKKSMIDLWKTVQTKISFQVLYELDIP